MHRYVIAALLLCLLSATLCSAQQTPKKPAGNPPILQKYETKYYMMYTDLDAADAREAAIRMTKMAEEYHNRTSDFSGTINQKLPFYLFTNPDDYYAAGGLPGSAGIFNGQRLMGIAGDHPTPGTWHIVQHEGFHQFAAAVIGGQLPVWLNEGLAEYFGEAVFTGDGFISGGIPSLRMRRVRAELDAPEGVGFKTLPQLMLLSHEKWNSEMSLQNYDQAWSLVHFLAHADDGKYQKTFSTFMRLLSRGGDWQVAWKNTFGDASGLEVKWREWWKASQRPTDVLYAKANVMVLTGFLGRCSESKQTFDSFEEYLKAIDDTKLKIPDSDWLPSSLIEGSSAVAARRIEEGAKYTIADKGRSIVCVLPDGTKITGHYTISGGKISEVTAVVVEPRPTTNPTK